MSKTIKKCFDEKLTYINLYNAYYRICKCKRNKKYILKYAVDLEIGLNMLLQELKDNKYKLGNYHEFTIYEPKERLIKAFPFRDRIVHQWYIEEFIKPYIIPRFIIDSYSCIEGRGSHKGVNKLQKYMRSMYLKNNDYYVLKCDISKYFYSIDRDILFDIISKYFSDKKLLNLTKIIIYDNSNELGIPIGNYTSQYFANIYLNELDYFVKEELKVKYYIRYMDDFVMLLDNKNECIRVMREINDFLNDRLHLKLNKKSKYFHNKYGINFLGYRIFNDYRLLRKNSIKKIKKNIRMWKKKYGKDLLKNKNVVLSINSWYAHIKHCDSYRLKNKIIKYLLKI